MKRLNYFVALFGLLSVMALGFSACSDDDDDVDISALYGTWELIHSKGYEIWDGERESWDEDITSDYDKDRITFEEDGTVTGYEYYNGTWHVYESASFTVSGNQLRINGEAVTILGLSATRLVLAYSYKDGDEEEYSEDTYKKID